MNKGTCSISKGDVFVKRNRVRNVTCVLFVMLQMILYVTFLTLDIRSGSTLISRNVKYSIIILCFCYALFWGNRAHKSIFFCMIAGLLFTVISDLFLLILDCYTYGVLTFIIVQLFYGIRITLADMKIHRRGAESKEDGSCKMLFLHRLTLRIGVELMIAFIVCLILWLAEVPMGFLLIISVFYFTCIVTNTVTAMKSAMYCPRNRCNLLFAVGMGLFLLCDINVGLFNLSGFISLPANIYDFLYSMSSVLMWTFYAPSQIIIALSISENY